jgi:hypothetical protein
MDEAYYALSHHIKQFSISLKYLNDNYDSILSINL